MLSDQSHTRSQSTANKLTGLGGSQIAAGGRSRGQGPALTQRSLARALRGGYRRTGLSGLQRLLQDLTPLSTARGVAERCMDPPGSPLRAPPSPCCTPNTQNPRELRECHPALGPQRPTATSPGFTPREETGRTPPTQARRGRAAEEAGKAGGERERGATSPARPRWGSPAPAAARGHVRGAERRRRPKGAAVSASPAARGDAALQLGAHGHRHHPPEAVRRRRPRPAEGARGGTGARGTAAGRSRGRGRGAKRRLDTRTRPPPPVVYLRSAFLLLFLLIFGVFR